jgi:UDP-2,4-diacetamido-2,4,6-trideoxy-beta-L-altropyranose hydrolase
MRVVFRADASRVIGSGHVMRCLTLATALRERGAEVWFVTRELEGHPFRMIEREGIGLLRLDASTAMSEEADAAGTSTALRRSSLAPDWVVVDHYELGATWEASLREQTGRLMVIDDLANRRHECDLLLDQNELPSTPPRYEGLMPSSGQLLLGPRYALLQPSFAEARALVAPREGPVRRLFIYFGGADRRNLTDRCLDAFLALGPTGIDVDVVVSDASPDLPAIRRRAARHPNIHLHEALPTLAPLMAKADLALGACGATTWERCCLGLPALVVTIADNQRRNAAALHEAGAVEWLGDQDDVHAPRIGAALRANIERGLTRDWSLRCSALVDGAGADRVCAALLGARAAGDVACSAADLRIRPATLADEAMLLRWRNDASTIASSREARAITEREHAAWIRGVLSDADRQLYIVEHLNEPAGTVRVDRSDAGQELSWTVAPHARGKGIGKAMVKLVADTLTGVVFADVKPSNQASAAIAVHAGLVREGEWNGMRRFARPR